MKLVTFGIDRDRNLIIQFPVFLEPYTATTNIISNRDCTSSNYRSKHASTLLYTDTGR